MVKDELSLVLPPRPVQALRFGSAQEAVDLQSGTSTRSLSSPLRTALNALPDKWYQQGTGDHSSREAQAHAQVALLGYGHAVKYYSAHQNAFLVV